MALKLAPQIAPAVPDMRGIRTTCPIRAIHKDGPFVVIETFKEKLILTQYEASRMAYAVCCTARDAAKLG